jgi:hypothetical protein
MDSLTDILSNKQFAEPDELTKLKKFIKDEYSSAASISINGQSIIISVKSSSLASSLRLRLPEIKRKLSIEQPIRLRIY